MKDRKAPRFKVHVRIYFANAEGTLEGEGTVMNLSKTGCCVESETDVPAGAELEAKIFLPDHDWPLKVARVMVRWSQHDAFGIEFVEMLPAQRERLRLAIESTRLAARSIEGKR